MKTIILETEEKEIRLTNKQFIELAKQEWREDMKINEDLQEFLHTDYPLSEDEINSFDTALKYIERWFIGRYVAIWKFNNPSCTKYTMFRKLPEDKYLVTTEKDYHLHFLKNKKEYDKKTISLVKKWKKSEVVLNISLDKELFDMEDIYLRMIGHLSGSSLAALHFQDKEGNRYTENLMMSGCQHLDFCEEEAASILEDDIEKLNEIKECLDCLGVDIKEWNYEPDNEKEHETISKILDFYVNEANSFELEEDYIPLIKLLIKFDMACFSNNSWLESYIDIEDAEGKEIYSSYSEGGEVLSTVNEFLHNDYNKYRKTIIKDYPIAKEPGLLN